MVIAINLSPTTPPLPRFEDKKSVDVRYILIAPYVSAHIYWNKELSELVYELEEPILNDREKESLTNQVQEGICAKMLALCNLCLNVTS